MGGASGCVGEGQHLRQHGHSFDPKLAGIRVPSARRQFRTTRAPDPDRLPPPDRPGADTFRTCPTPRLLPEVPHAPRRGRGTSTRRGCAGSSSPGHACTERRAPHASGRNSHLGRRRPSSVGVVRRHLASFVDGRLRSSVAVRRCRSLVIVGRWSPIGRHRPSSVRVRSAFVVGRRSSIAGRHRHSSVGRLSSSVVFRRWSVVPRPRSLSVVGQVSSILVGRRSSVVGRSTSVIGRRRAVVFHRRTSIVGRRRSSSVPSVVGRPLSVIRCRLALVGRGRSLSTGSGRSTSASQVALISSAGSTLSLRPCFTPRLVATACTHVCDASGLLRGAGVHACDDARSSRRESHRRCPGWPRRHSPLCQRSRRSRAQRGSPTTLSSQGSCRKSDVVSSMARAGRGVVSSKVQRSRRRESQRGPSKLGNRQVVLYALQRRRAAA